jgi:hypothetical protein
MVYIDIMNNTVKTFLCALTVGLTFLGASADAAQDTPVAYSSANRRVAFQLSPEKTMADAEPGELAMGVRAAVRANPTQAGAIVGQVFSRFGISDSRKALAGIDAVASAVPASELPGVVRAAVSALPDRVDARTGLSARSVLGQLIAEEALTLSPARAYAIADTVRMLIWLATHGKGLHFHGPGDCDHPANYHNCGGPINSPCS